MEEVKNRLLGGGIFEVKVIPKASSNSIKLEGDVVKIKITTAPENGKANEAVIDLLHDTLHISRNRIQIVSGDRNRNKKIKIL